VSPQRDAAACAFEAPHTCAGALPLGDLGSPSGISRTLVTSIFNCVFHSAALLARERPAPKFRCSPPC